MHRKQRSQYPREICPFVPTDAGRSTSKRPKQKNDCTVRVLALVSGLKYDTCYDFLKLVFHRRPNRGCRFPGHCGDIELHMLDDYQQPCVFSLKWKEYSKTAKIRYSTFCKRHRYGTFITLENEHVSVVRDGVVLDDIRPYQGRLIYGYWKVTRVT